jgi:hypothetical protein
MSDANNPVVFRSAGSRSRAMTADLGNAVIGRLAGQDPAGHPLVVFPGEEERPQAAEFLRSAEPIDWTSCAGLRCLLAFPEGGDGRPVVLGLLDPRPGTAPPKPGTSPRGCGSVPGPADQGSGPRPQYLRLESERELILECGRAKISLRADGRIVILGGYLLSRSRGVNKIKGASVQIN